MSATTGIRVDDSKFSFLFGRIRNFFLRHPECWAWFFSLSVWAFLAINLFTASREIKDPHTVIYCMPAGAVAAAEPPGYEIKGTQNVEGISPGIFTAIPKGLQHWMIMVVAMMFPLLNEPLRHVSFSIRRKDRDHGVLCFLIGYTIIWTLAGVLFLFLPALVETVADYQTPFVNGLIKASGFLLAAILAWHPTRPIKMMKCGQTMPIRIHGWPLYFDCLAYGLKMGSACLSLCWVSMAALMLAHHNLALMYIVTIVLIAERYLLAHTSRLPGYAWALIALALFNIEIWA